MHLLPPEEQPLAILESLFLKNRSAASPQVKSALHDSYRRLIAPSLESETKQTAKGRADEEAIRVFVENLRHLLMAPPLGEKSILAIDPGFPTGCKTVCLDPQGKLRQALDDVVMSCVNGVGVDVNTASPQLLAYVSGIGPQLSRNILAYRNEIGPFRSKKELTRVPRMGPRAFQQASGFLRIRHGENPVDASAVHPESYQAVEAMARDLGCTVADLMGSEGVRRRIDPAHYVTGKVGLPTVNDILAELARPGRDPRESFKPFSFAQGVERIEDLEVGMRLPGIVTNVTAFGAFVDIGVHRDGLVHMSELSDRFIRDPSEAVRVHQRHSAWSRSGFRQKRRPRPW